MTDIMIGMAANLFLVLMILAMLFCIGGIIGIMFLALKEFIKEWKNG